MTVFVIKEPSSRNGTTQQVVFNSTAATSSGAFGTETYQVRLTNNAPCFYLIYSTTDTATQAGTNSPLLPANWVEYVTVNPGQKISAITDTVTGGLATTNGSLWVTELS